MTTISPTFQQLLSLFFPSDLLQFFDVKGTKETMHPKTGDITLEIICEEKNIVPPLPPEYRGKTVISKGFHRPITLQHFPLQDRLIHLTIIRRRWVTSDGKALERSLDFLPLRGLKLTTTFGDFLKEADRIGTGGD